MELGHGGRRDLGDDRNRPGDAHPHARTFEVQPGDLPAPNVARRSFRPAAMQRHGARVDHGEHLARAGARCRQRHSFVQLDMIVARPAAEQIHADQVGDVRRARPLRDLRRRPGLHDLSLFQHDEAGGQRHRFQRVVRHQDPKAVERLEMSAQRAAHFCPRPYVERRQGLVEKEHARLDRQGARQRDALGLTSGEIAGAQAGAGAQPDALEPLMGLLPRLAARAAVAAQAEGDVVERAEIREEQIVLEDIADRAPLRGNIDTRLCVLEHPPVESDAAFDQRHEPGQNAQESALPRSVRPKHRHHVARLHRQIDAEVESSERGVDAHLEAHSALHQRPRRATSTDSETASRIKLKTTPASGLVSNAR